MTDKIPQLRPRELIKILEKLGFVLRRQTGSHGIFRHPKTKNITIIPIHAKELKRGLLFGILKQVGITQEEFLKLLKG